MRGKAAGKWRPCGGNRITPAYAGKRHRADVQGVWRWDHPRLCGEKFSSLRQPMRLPGSPPPMRGKVSGESLDRFNDRITPAYAGKS